MSYPVASLEPQILWQYFDKIRKIPRGSGEEAAIREAKEETNLNVINLRQFHTYSKPDRDPRFHTISTVFIAEGQGDPQFGDDARGLKIVRYEDLPELDYAFDHKEIIKEYLIEKDLDKY